MNELRALRVSVRDKEVISPASLKAQRTQRNERFSPPTALFFPFGLLPAMPGGAGAPRTLNTVELSHGESARPEKDS